MKLLRIFSVTLVAMSLTNCETDLELLPLSQESSSTAFSTPSQLEAALIGVYDGFGGKTVDRQDEYYRWDMFNFQDTRSDNAYAGGDTPALFQVDQLNIVPTNDRLSWHWGALYNSIGKANNVLERAPLVEDEDFVTNRLESLMAEAYFLRAFHYYQLVTLWSGVPLILETTTSVDPDDVNVPRSTSEEVYAQILDDLGKAIAGLPDRYSGQGETKARATSGAANALAAKAHLQNPNPNYEAALGHILALESSSANYTLLANYDDLFVPENKNNAESILEIQFNGGEEQGFIGQLILPPSVRNVTWRTFITPSQDLVAAFNDEGDNIRLGSSIFFEEAPWVDEYWGNAIDSEIPFVWKYRVPGWTNNNNIYLIRYGDIVLLKAEALNQLGRIPEAAIEVNRIRARAGLPDLTAPQQSSQATMKAAILNERRLELAFEGERWNDLVRNNEAISTMNNLVEIDLRTGQPVDYNMSEDKLFVPIPQTEMDLNPALEQGRM